jgi:hypothetical protein
VYLDLVNPMMDLEDPNVGSQLGVMLQRLDKEQCTNVPNLQDNKVTQGPVNKQLTAQQLW